MEIIVVPVKREGINSQCNAKTHLCLIAYKFQQQKDLRFSKVFNNFMKKSRTEFSLSGIVQYSRLLVCLNIDCSSYMCRGNLQLVFSTKIPYCAGNIIASLRFHVPHIVDITYSCDIITHNPDIVLTICIDSYFNCFKL